MVQLEDDFRLAEARCMRMQRESVAKEALIAANKIGRLLTNWVKTGVSPGTKHTPSNFTCSKP